MTNKIKGLTVIFNEDFSQEEANTLKSAIQLFRGVASVVLSEAAGYDLMERERVRVELVGKLFDVLREKSSFSK